MRSAVLFTVVLAALGLAAEASAGCFATAGLTAPPATVGPGDTWNALITVKQHGTRPIPDAQPTLTIQGENGATKTFAAKPTDTVGVYAASVVFPSAGQWSYVVDDGFVDSGGGPVLGLLDHAHVRSRDDRRSRLVRTGCRRSRRGSVG